MVAMATDLTPLFIHGMHDGNESLLPLIPYMAPSVQWLSYNKNFYMWNAFSSAIFTMAKIHGQVQGQLKVNDFPFGHRLPVLPEVVDVVSNHAKYYIHSLNL